MALLLAVALVLLCCPTCTLAAALPWGGGLAARCEYAARRLANSSSHSPQHGGGCYHLAERAAGGHHPGVPDCTEKFFNQTVDHFGFATPHGESSFQQRYFVYDQWWLTPAEDPSGIGGPIFFYTGNEANVELYVNATGLIWENCEAAKCLIIFAEHRYWGKSLMPWDPPSASGVSSLNLDFLTHEQALADYASMLYVLRQELGAVSAPTIAFGGSYGGMLAYWLRQKYPGAVDGAIAASAPVLAFKGQTPAYDSESYWAVVTRDATAAAGSTPECADGVRKAWRALASGGASASGRSQLQSLFGLCAPVSTEADVAQLVDLLWFAIDTMAMGDYPYPSNYLTNGGPLLAAFPMRTGCKAFATTSSDSTESELLSALGKMAAVFNNATGQLSCFDLPSDDEDDGMWDYLWCTETLPQETYFRMDGVRDMFWPKPYNSTWINARCQRKYQTQPRYDWISASYGGHRGVRATTNVVFSNGALDPWSSGGVSYNGTATEVRSLLISQGAHHLDLMFSNPQDPQCVKDARKSEVDQINAWVQAARRRALEK